MVARAQTKPREPSAHIFQPLLSSGLLQSRSPAVLAHSISVAACGLARLPACLEKVTGHVSLC